MQHDEMIDFYSRLFHCKPLYSSKDITFLAFNEEYHCIQDMIAFASEGQRIVPDEFLGTDAPIDCTSIEY